MLISATRVAMILANFEFFLLFSFFLYDVQQMRLGNDPFYYRYLHRWGAYGNNDWVGTRERKLLPRKKDGVFLLFRVIIPAIATCSVGERESKIERRGEREHDGDSGHRVDTDTVRIV